MPSRRIVRDEEYLKIAADPEAAKARLDELREERNKLAQETLNAEALAKLAEELEIKKHELDGRERQHWEKEDAFYKEQATKRHAIEKREQEAEDLLVKASDWQREADKRHTALDERETATKLGETNLHADRESFAKQQQEAEKQFLAREQKSLAEIANREKAVTAREAAVASYANEVADKERAVESERLSVEEWSQEIAKVAGKRTR